MFQKKTSTLSAPPSHSNHEISEAGNGRKQRLTPLPTRSSNICSSNQVGHHFVRNNLSFPSVDPHQHASMKLDSVNTQQGCSMKRTESEAVSHSGESLVTPYTSTYEETSSRVDVVLKLTSLLFAANQKHEVSTASVGASRRVKEATLTMKTANKNVKNAKERLTLAKIKTEEKKMNLIAKTKTEHEIERVVSCVSKKYCF